MDILHPVAITAHIIFAVAMIAIVLLQTGKGAGLSGVFGAGGAASESCLGGPGPRDVLNQVNDRRSHYVYGNVARTCEVIVDAAGRQVRNGRK
jgi:protein translocase SecG subunit